MFTTNITPAKLMMTIGFVSLGLSGFTAPALAGNVVSHTQSSVQVGTPGLPGVPVTTTRTNTIVDPQGKLEGQIIRQTTTTPAQQIQTKRSTILNPDGSVESRAQASSTTYDANGQLVTTHKSAVLNSDNAVTTGVVVPGVAVNADGNIDVYQRVETPAGNSKIIHPSTTGYGAVRTGGNFNE